MHGARKNVRATFQNLSCGCGRPLRIIRLMAIPPASVPRYASRLKMMINLWPVALAMRCKARAETISASRPALP